jgi:DNA-binding transcriptional MerR regulator
VVATDRIPARWRIDELGAAVSAALAIDYDGPANGQIRAVPDPRTIRYYSTLGLIDPPAEMRGRTALYSRRHLLQLVAIKRLQAEGLSLSEIQARLAGATDADLDPIARLPEALGAAPEAATEAGPEETARRRGTFWREAPVSAPAPPAVDFVAHIANGADHAETEPAHRALDRVGVSLSTDVILLFVPSRAIEEQDREALVKAAAPLIEQLVQRALIEASPASNQGESK